MSSDEKITVGLLTATVTDDFQLVLRVASRGYIDVFKIPVLRGRSFAEQDNEASPPVVLINEAMAKRFWPNQNPLGQQIVTGNG